MIRRIAPLFTGLVLLTGCPDIPCTDLAASSVNLTVLDAGSPLETARATWAVDGGTANDCDDGFDPGTFVCGYEQAGLLTIVVTAPDYDSVTEDVQIDLDADECHVVGKPLEVTLLPTATQ